MLTKRTLLLIIAVALTVCVGISIARPGANGVVSPEQSTISQGADCRGDFDNSGQVDFSDFLAFAGGFGKRSGDADYNDVLDLDDNGAVDFSDFLAFAGQFGVTCESPPPDVVTLPPPTWVFAGHVPTRHQNVLRDEMEYVRAFFFDRHGVRATGFTVLVGGDEEAVSVEHRRLIGRPLDDRYDWPATRSDAYVTRTVTGGAVMVIWYRLASFEALSSSKSIIAHEYFHVLQGQLASGFATLQDGEIAWYGEKSAVRGPNWLVEGTAAYADYEYTPVRAGRRPFFDRYTPYEDLTWHHLDEPVSTSDWARIEDPDRFRFPLSLVEYALSFIATVFLVEQAGADSYVNFWKLIGERPAWEQAFEEAFGIGVNDFYKAFHEWLPSQMLPLVQLKVRIRWPDMENQFDPETGYFDRVGFLYVDWDVGSIFKGFRGGGAIRNEGWIGAKFTYEQGSLGTTYLSLYWYEYDNRCTQHLLGWYNDGKLTGRREDATAVAFTGTSSTIVWNLPGSPDTLPRLKEREAPGCR